MCYPGPAGTQFKGNCKGGMSLCQNGDWGDCLGHVVPTFESCTSIIDSNCDGRMGCKGVPSSGNTIGTTKADAFVSIAAAPGVDGNYGHVYGTGYLNATIQGDGTLDTGKVLFGRREPSGTLTDWSNQFNIASFGHAQGFGLAIDPSKEDVAVVGAYKNGSLSIGGQGLPAAGPLMLGFLASFDINGAFRFSKSFGTSGSILVTDVAVSKDGDIFVGGQFNSTIDFGGPTAVSVDGYDAFVASYSNTGVLRWKHVLAGSGDQSVDALAVDDAGNVFVATRFNGLINVAPNVTLAPEGENDVVVSAHETKSGMYIWANHIGGTGDMVVHDLAAGNGTVAVVAAFRGGIDIGAATYTSSDAPPYWDGAVAKLDSVGGAATFVTSFIAGETQVPSGVAIDSFGDVTVDGYFSEQLPIGGGIVDLTSGSGDINAFVVKFDSNLNPRWGHGYGNSLAQEFTDIAVDPTRGDLFVGGRFDGILLGFGVISPTSNGGFDAFMGAMSN